MSFTKRALGALAAGAIALPFLASPALAAPGDTPIPPPQEITTFCENAIEADFSDVLTDGDALANELSLAIDCLATAGIAFGFEDGTYKPQANVTRGQMALFINRLIHAAADRERTENSIRELPAPAPGNPFPGDLAPGDFRLDEIKQLVQAGIVNGNPGTAQQPNGIGADKYGPELPVTRAQMASFINRAVAYMTGGDPSRAGTPGNGYAAPDAEYYVDPQQQTHAANVRGITSAGISNGVGGDRYDGLGNVSRQQMARFLARTLSDLYDKDLIYSVLELFTESFGAGRENATRVATPGTDGSTAADSRDFAVDGLNPATQYRITLVTCDSVTRLENDLVTFSQETVNGQRLATTGSPQADIVQVNGAATPADTMNTTTANPGSNGVLTFRIEGDAAECVTAVVYINGDAGKPLNEGGTSPRLEVDANGYPIEFFGISGDTTFTAEPGVVDGEATVTVNEESVQAGDPITGTVTGDQPIVRVTVSGDCIETTVLTPAGDLDTNTPGIQFSIDTLADAAAGDCVLTFVTEFENGTTDTDTDTVTIVRDGTATTTATATGTGTASSTATASGSGTATVTTQSQGLFDSLLNLFD